MHVFVVSKKSVRKEFIQFTTRIQVTGKSIAEQICDDLKLLSLNIKNIRGRGYDGASSIGVVTTLELQEKINTCHIVVDIGQKRIQHISISISPLFPGS